MRSILNKRPMIALLTFALVASTCQVAQSGPISDMLARHRQNRQMKLPPMDPPFSKKPVKDLNTKTASLSTKLKKRFSFKKDGPTDANPFSDSNVMKTSR